jgi:hypothetical protein
MFSGIISLIQMTHLFLLAAYWPVFPFIAAQIHQFLPNSRFGLLGEAIIGAWKLSTKERLLSTVASDGTSPRFVNFRLALRYRLREQA